MIAHVDVRQWLGDERFMYGPGTESRAKCDEAFAAVAELIGAAEEVQADALILGMEIPRLVAALARVKGGAA